MIPRSAPQQLGTDWGVSTLGSALLTIIVKRFDNIATLQTLFTLIEAAMSTPH